MATLHESLVSVAEDGSRALRASVLAVASAILMVCALLMAAAGCCEPPPPHETQDWRQQSEAFNAEQWSKVDELEKKMRQLQRGYDSERERRAESDEE
jgi:hypothetical protein